MKALSLLSFLAPWSLAMSMAFGDEIQGVSIQAGRLEADGAKFIFRSEDGQRDVFDGNGEANPLRGQLLPGMKEIGFRLKDGAEYYYAGPDRPNRFSTKEDAVKHAAKEHPGMGGKGALLFLPEMGEDVIVLKCPGETPILRVDINYGGLVRTFWAARKTPTKVRGEKKKAVGK